VPSRCWLTEQLDGALTRVQAGGVTPTIDMPRFCAELEAMDFEHPRPLQQMLHWSIERMEHGIVQMSNPRYFACSSGANFPAQCADRIIGAFNPQLASSASSPVPVAIESHTIRAVARRAAHGRERHRAFRHGGSRRTIRRSSAH